MVIHNAHLPVINLPAFERGPSVFHLDGCIRGLLSASPNRHSLRQLLFRSRHAHLVAGLHHSPCRTLQLPAQPRFPHVNPCRIHLVFAPQILHSERRLRAPFSGASQHYCNSPSRSDRFPVHPQPPLNPPSYIFFVPWQSPNCSMGPATVQPSISTVRCKALKNLSKTCYSVPCISNSIPADLSVPTFRRSNRSSFPRLPRTVPFGLEHLGDSGRLL